MAKGHQIEEVEQLLATKSALTTADFFAVMSDCPAQTVYSRIRSLVQKGRLQTIGHGMYVVGARSEYKEFVSPWMEEVSRYLIEYCPGINHCVRLCRKNLFVEVDKTDIKAVSAVLKNSFPKVAEYKQAKDMIDILEGAIIIRQMITEAPIIKQEGCFTPSLEKNLVDSIAEGVTPEPELQKYFQRAFEVYPVNRSTLLRYASRRNVKSAVEKHISRLDRNRMDIIKEIQDFFSTQPIDKAWLFGSYSRCEEHPESDVDLLVDFTPSANISLMDHVRISESLQNRIKKDVDLVTNGTLLPFAARTADNDKYLIYERTNQRSR